MKNTSLLFGATLLMFACGGDDGGDTDAGNTIAPPPSETYSAPEGEWTFIADAGMTCMDGSKTGFGIRPVDDSRGLQIFLQDGGVCFDPFTCGQVFNPNGFNAASLATWAGRTGVRGMFDQTSSPFANYTQVFVPYCSGDVHGGQNPNGPEGRVHVGYNNVTAVLDSLGPAFEGRLDKVILAGASAGALGSYLNFEQTADTFADVPVHLMADSGALLKDDVLTPCLQQRVRDTFNLTLSLPSGCTECTGSDGGGLFNIFKYLSTAHADSRFALITSVQDATFRLFFGFGYPDCSNPQVPMDAAVFAGGVAGMTSEVDAFSNMNVFTLGGDGHVFVYQSSLEGVTSEGETLQGWLSDFESGAAGWQDVIPQ